MPKPQQKHLPHSQHWLDGHPRPVREAVMWVQKNLQLILYGIGAISLIAVLWGGTSWYHWHTGREAMERYAQLPVEAEARAAGMAEIAAAYPKTGAGILTQFHLGRRAYEAGDYDEAALWFGKVGSLAGDQHLVTILAQHNLGAVLEAKGDWAGALEFYQKAAVDPANKTAVLSYYHLGRMAQALERWDEARQWFEKVVEEGSGLAVARQAKDRLLWLDIQQSS